MHFLKVLFGRLKIRLTSDSINEMIQMLANCTSLVRLGLIVTSIDLGVDGNLLNMHKLNEREFTDIFVNLVEQLPKLIALLVVVPRASPSHCFAATKTLETLYQPKRPCFCVQITDSLSSNAPSHLPLCHFKVLAHDLPPLVGGLPFHLESQEARC